MPVDSSLPARARTMLPFPGDDVMALLPLIARCSILRGSFRAAASRSQPVVWRFVPEQLGAVFLLFLLWVPLLPAAMAAVPQVTVATTDGSEPDLQWFRDQLHIAPQFQEHGEGIFGLSWLHFLTMAFLILFFVVATILHVLHTRRKQEIINTLLQEEDDRKPSGGASQRE